jgi:hypothetical protein
MARSRIIDKLDHELAQPIESERQVVYILVVMRNSLKSTSVN